MISVHEQQTVFMQIGLSDRDILQYCVILNTLTALWIRNLTCSLLASGSSIHNLLKLHFTVCCVLIRTQPCASLWFNNLSITAAHFRESVSTDMCQVEFTRAADLYRHSDIDPLPLLSLSHPYTHTRTHCVFVQSYRWG